MAKTVQEILIKLGVQGDQQVQNLVKAFRNLDAAIAPADKSINDARRALLEFGQANVLTERNIYKQISGLKELRSQTSLTGNTYRLLTKDIDLLDAKLNKLSATRNKLTAGQAVQAAGAVISGGIFGGPEGFLGGIAGVALGSAIPGLGPVGGAFAGSALGAQLGQLRQQITGATEYAAQIQKVQISLRGVAGSQDEYNRAIAASQQVTKDYNISQLESLTGFTKLTASIKGAGGNVADAEAVFRGVTVAIKATGGGAEQVQGSLLAMSQIFSKGKVSAEELNQIAERLPGAFSLFAAASKMTGPQLRDGLEKGTVGLANVMKFVDLLKSKYSNLAKLIADSSVDAGARTQVAFQNMQLEVGKALQPIGAKFQDAFAKFLYEITPAVVSAAKGLAAALKFISDNIELLKGIGSVALEIGKVMLAFKAAELAVSLFGKSLNFVKNINIAGSLAATAGGIRITGDASAAAATKVNFLGGAFGRLLRFGIITVGIEVVTRGLGGLIRTMQMMNEVKNFSTNKYYKDIGGSAATTDTIKENLKAVKEQIKAQQSTIANIEKLERPFKTKGAGEYIDKETAKLARVATGAYYNTNLPAHQGVLETLKLKEARLTDMLGKAPEGPSSSRTDFENLFDDTKKKKTGGKGAANAAAREAASDLKRQRDLQRQIFADSSASLAPILATKNKISQIDRDITKAAADGNGELAIKLERSKLEFQLALELEDIEKTRLDALRKNADDADQTNRKLADQATNTAAIKDILIATNKWKQDSLDLTAKETALIEAQNKSYAQSLQDRQRELGLMSKKDYNKLLLGREKERVGREYGYLPQPQQDQMVDLYRQKIDPTFGEAMRTQIVSMEEQLNNLSAVATSVSQSIGSALANSLVSGISGLIQGTTTAKQVFASFLQDVGRILLEEATKMIATYIAIGIAKAFAGLAGGGGGGGSKMESTLAGWNAYSANGASFSNGIAAFAYGGIVNKPTTFKFADGGATKTGLMAEAGPEAIMPLKRDRSGRLGVALVDSREALGTRQGSSTASDAFSANRESLSNTATLTRERRVEQLLTSGASSTEIKYSRVGSGDLPFVTEQDMLKASRLATQEGAKLGQQRTLAALRNNPSTRRGIGI